LPGNDQEEKPVKFFANLVAKAIIKAKGHQDSAEQIEEKVETETG
jgi:ribosomal protein S2